LVRYKYNNCIHIFIDVPYDNKHNLVTVYAHARDATRREGRGEKRMYRTPHATIIYTVHFSKHTVILFCLRSCSDYCWREGWSFQHRNWYTTWSKTSRTIECRACHTVDQSATSSSTAERFITSNISYIFQISIQRLEISIKMLEIW